MSGTWNTYPESGPQATAPASGKNLAWAPWLTVGGAALGFFALLMPWVSAKSEGKYSSGDTIYLNKLAGTGWLGEKASTGGWEAHAWLTVLVLLALIMVGMMLLLGAPQARLLTFVLAGLAVANLILAIWGIIAASTLSGWMEDKYGMEGSVKAGMGFGPWLYLLLTLAVLAGAALTLLPALKSGKAATQAQQPMYGQPQPPQHVPPQGWGQPPAPQSQSYPQAPPQSVPPQGAQQPPQGWGQPGAPQQPMQQGWNGPQQGDQGQPPRAW